MHGAGWGLGSHKHYQVRRDKTATALNPPPAHCSLQKLSSADPACCKSARETREVVLASVGNRHTFLIPQLTKEPLPGLVGRSSTTPSRYSESSSIRMWWGLSRGLSSPRTAQSKEVLGENTGVGAAAPLLLPSQVQCRSREKSWLFHTQ